MELLANCPSQHCRTTSTHTRVHPDDHSSASLCRSSFFYTQLFRTIEPNQVPSLCKCIVAIPFGNSDSGSKGNGSHIDYLYYEKALCNVCSPLVSQITGHYFRVVDVCQLHRDKIGFTTNASVASRLLRCINSSLSLLTLHANGKQAKGRSGAASCQMEGFNPELKTLPSHGWLMSL